MVEIAFNNVHATFIGNFHEDQNVSKGYNEAIRKELSYLSNASTWSDKFKNNKWDGRISLYNPYKQTFPTGLMKRAALLLKELDTPIKVTDKRKKPEPNFHVETRFHELGRKLHLYQEETARRALKSTRGIVSIGTGGGKTYISCEMMRVLACSPILFVVPYKSLLHQTAREFSKLLKRNDVPEHIGRIGDGVCDINLNGVNVATYQTLLTAFDKSYTHKNIKNADGSVLAKADTIYDNSASKAKRKTNEELQAEYETTKKKYEAARAKAEKLAADMPYMQKRSFVSNAVAKHKEAYYKAKAAHNDRVTITENRQKIKELVENCVVFLADETHIAAVIIEYLGQQARNAYYRFGISATPYREDNQEIRIEGAFGSKIIHVPSSALIQLDILVKPYILVVKDNYVEASASYPDAYDKHIINNWNRNYRIKEFAEQFKERGWPTMIFVDQLNHGRMLETMIKDSVFVSGSDDDTYEEDEENYRQAMLNKMQNNEIILIATSWAYTGIDAPKCQGLIMGGAVAATSTTMQMIGRVLRKAPGKEFAVCVDFDSDQKQLHKQAVARQNAYRTEPEYEVIRIR